MSVKGVSNSIRIISFIYKFTSWSLLLLTFTMLASFVCSIALPYRYHHLEVICMSPLSTFFKVLGFNKWFVRHHFWYFIIYFVIVMVLTLINLREFFRPSKKLLVVYSFILILLLMINFTYLGCYIATVTPRDVICRSFLAEIVRSNLGAAGCLAIIILILSYVLAGFMTYLIEKLFPSDRINTPSEKEKNRI